MKDANITPGQSPARGENGIDWEQIHRRLDASAAELARKLNPSPDVQRAVLRARARELAREIQTAEAPGESVEVIEFVLAGEHYAIESRYIREICPLQDLTPVPCAPAFVMGLILIRGEIVSVIDIRKVFELPEKGLTDLNKVLILQTPYMEFGILADAVVGMRSISPEDLVTSLPALTGIRTEYLKGSRGIRSLFWTPPNCCPAHALSWMRMSKLSEQPICLGKDSPCGGLLA
jgi:purine-binding chemotaxis protein CheW